MSKTLSIQISIKSLNHRFFDLSFRGNLTRDRENRLRAICQKNIHRGRIDISFESRFLDTDRFEVRINKTLLSEILSSLEKVSSPILKNLTFSIESLFNIPNIAELVCKEYSDEEMLFIEKCFLKTLKNLIKMRLREGMELKKSIRSYVLNIKRLLSKMEKLAKKQPSLIHEKLKKRLVELGSDVSIPEEKLVQEAGFLAQKYDLTEELTRLKCHIGHVEELLLPSMEEPAGKKMDFIAQELYREANTINSKAQDIEIIKESLTVKSEVESIRQQVQNIE